MNGESLGTKMVLSFGPHRTTSYSLMQISCLNRTPVGSGWPLVSVYLLVSGPLGAGLDGSTWVG